MPATTIRNDIDKALVSHSHTNTQTNELLLLSFLSVSVGTRSPTRMSITSGNNVFYYMVRDTLCFLSMTESSYPKRMGFLYLDEVADLILSELVNEFGNEVSGL